MTGGGLFGTGISGMLAYQRALQVAGHNIANVGTEGYSRQRVDLAAQSPAITGIGAVGSGVATVGVDRIANVFVDARLVTNTAAEAYHRTFAEFASQVNNLVADFEAGLSPALDSFFAAVQEVATDPTSTAARQQLIGQGEALVARFAQVDSRVQELHANANGRIAGTVAEINQLAAGIAELNQRIIIARGGGGAQEPNDLLDRRDAMLRDLAERVSVTTLEQDDGSLNVYAGQGQALVVGVVATPLDVEPSRVDPNRFEVGFRNASGFFPVTETLTGGELGALLESRSSVLDAATRSLGRVALAVTDLFNQAHANGIDLRGQLGTEFFGVPDLPVLADRDNTATPAPLLTLADATSLEAADYDLRFDGANWVLTRLTDGAQLASLAPGSSFSFDGLNLDLSGVGAAAINDRFLLKPTAVNSDLSVLIADPQSIAAALPVRAAAADANTGGGSVHDLAILDVQDPSLRNAVDVTYSGGNFVAGAVSVPLDPSGATTIDINGWRLVVRGTPADGDVFSVTDNTGGIGDNRNALALAELPTLELMAGGTATLSESYAEVVADIGIRTKQAQISADVQERLLAEAKTQRESVSGVNLDEEAADLIRYQQAYEASAQVIAVAASLFETLIAAVRR